MKNITNEAGVKDEVKKILNRTPDCWWYMPVQTGYGVHGIPDFIACVRGSFIAIETKFGRNKLSAWQERQKVGIMEAKGTYFVVNETSLGKFASFVDFLVVSNDHF